MAGFRPNWRALLVALPPVVAALWLWVAFVEDMGAGEATWTAMAAAGFLCVLSVAEDAWEHWRRSPRGRPRHRRGPRGADGSGPGLCARTGP